MSNGSRTDPCGPPIGSSIQLLKFDNDIIISEPTNTG